ncbi:unnamed protein product [Penicillium salamii]|uniref:Zn(2)-C6 fungal-type domain-containing protein n=1 Tax=Penicillium salamii TaxID=1612424 RepID=A0A9W4JT25_9EURO|nr:unnamed protein product [Penicillium salamii]CAG8252296.1 unnamed protein product [Penicillium salamii]CAG8255894.1 unnamed protein product [Penicillium salamii]CAG8270835.1 unnamed protein product [Penicillium salamii]CAG8273053.1 unnamed protein product [Penicillium salamii]
MENITDTTGISHLVPLAPAPTRAPFLDAVSGPVDADQMAAMRFNCQSCVRKKVKCDRAVPKCAGCSKYKLHCVYQPPPPPRKRKRHGDEEEVHERVARYERILHNHGLLPTAAASTPSGRDTETLAISTRAPTPASLDSQPNATADKLALSTDAGSRYIDNVLLLDAGEGDLCELPESEHEDSHHGEFGTDEGTLTGLLGTLAAHTISGTILRSTQSLAELHPTHDEAAQLWRAYLRNVEPLCKILHVPTVAKMYEVVSKHPAAASKNDECLLFVIYYFAVFSMSDADCLREFNQSRARLLSRYQTTIVQALINASWLKTTAMPILQAYTLFLIALRTQLDSHTFWILTGIAIRLAQRMGLHRDGESLGLPPFEVQMRRRLFWQLLPLDSYAGQTSGTGISISPSSWDTKQPLNLNDDQIFPGMTEPPCEQRGASEMIFCLSRMELSNFYIRTGVKLKENGDMTQFRDAHDIERLIDEVEDLIETKFLRYCDILNPLHFLTTGIVRSAIDSVRLRARIPLLKQQNITDAHRRQICALAEKVLDTNNTIFSNPSTQNFRWQMQAFFLWDALLCILRSIAEVGFYSSSELAAAWSKVAAVYANHEELIKSRRTLYVTISKVTLKAWFANPPGHSSPEPAFITALLARDESRGTNRQQDSCLVKDKPGDGAFSFGELFNNTEGNDLDMNNLLNLDSCSDLPFWD